MFTLGTGRLCSVFSLHRCHLLALPLDALICQQLHDIPRSQLRTVHLQVQHNVLAALEETAKKSDRDIFILYLGTDAAELGDDVDDFVESVQHIATFCHVHDAQMTLQANALILLQPAVHCLDCVRESQASSQSSNTLW